MNKLEVVWNRQDECLIPVRTWKNNLGVSMELSVKKLKKLCKDERVSFDEFIEYAQKRAKENSD